MGKNILHMLKNASRIQMQSFIVEEQTGKLLVIDGGMEADAPHLLERLRQITGQSVPHVDAWLFTHAHLDHMDAFLKLFEHSPEAFTFDKLLCCFPSEQYLALEQDPNGGAKTLIRFNRLRARIGSRLVTVSEDDEYRFGTAKLQVLRTVDCSIKTNVVNNSSVVYKLWIGTKTVLFLGDLGQEGGEMLRAAKPEQLKSDICQMAHHGQRGVDARFYQAVAPEVCLWCAPDWLWDNDGGKGFDTSIFETVRTREWMQKLGVQTHYVCKDGDHALECGRIGEGDER